MRLAPLTTPAALRRDEPPRDPRSRFPAGFVPEPAPSGRRAVVAEPDPRSRAAIEWALLGEGYRLVEGAPPAPSDEPVLLLAGDGGGLHVLASRDIAGALAGLSGGAGAVREESPAAGIHAFVPRPFGAADVLRLARAVSGFDCRRRSPGR